MIRKFHFFYIILLDIVLIALIYFFARLFDFSLAAYHQRYWVLYIVAISLMGSNIPMYLTFRLYQKRILNKKFKLRENEKEISRFLVNEESRLWGGFLLVSNQRLIYYRLGEKLIFSILEKDIHGIKVKPVTIFPGISLYKNVFLTEGSTKVLYSEKPVKSF